MMGGFCYFKGWNKVAGTCNPSTWEAERGNLLSLGVGGQPGKYYETLSSKKKKKSKGVGVVREGGEGDISLPTQEPDHNIQTITSSKVLKVSFGELSVNVSQPACLPSFLPSLHLILYRVE